MLTLFDNWDSGNGYKVRLLLAHLGVDYKLVDLDTDGGATRTAEFLAVNPNGKIPAIVLDDGRALFESNAIMLYLAEGSALLPTESFARAQVAQWLFFEQYSHEPYVAVARYIHRHLPAGHVRYGELPACWDGSSGWRHTTGWWGRNSPSRISGFMPTAMLPIRAALI